MESKKIEADRASIVKEAKRMERAAINEKARTRLGISSLPPLPCLHCGRTTSCWHHPEYRVIAQLFVDKMRELERLGRTREFFFIFR